MHFLLLVSSCGLKISVLIAAAATISYSISFRAEPLEIFKDMRPLRGLQETRVATREESGVLVFPRRGPRRRPGRVLDIVGSGLQS